MNTNDNEVRSLSQKQLILRMLNQGAVLTPLDALWGVGSMKLSTRISELINEGHTEIQKTRVQVPTANGKSAWVMSYSIPEDQRNQTSTTED